MKLASLFLLFFSSTVFASYEGKFTCANRPGLPDNTYSIQFSKLGELGAKIPYVIAERYYREGSEANSPVRKSTLSGLAVVSENDVDTVLMVGSIRIEIVDDVVRGCKKTN